MAVTSLDTPSAVAVLALTRFGLGCRPGDRTRIESDPRGALKAELERPRIALLDDPKLQPTPAIALAFLENRAVRRMQRGLELNPRQEALIERLRSEERLPPIKAQSSKAESFKPEAPEAKQPKADADAQMMAQQKPAARKAGPDADGQGGVRAGYALEIGARMRQAVECDIGFVERLVHFWANHFAVSAEKGGLTRVTVGAFEREAIRPHVLGRFSDMLSAATRHPAMLSYLDNVASLGPSSPAGVRQNKGLNENHARELLELHTLGVDGGYSQADVTAFAKTLTGWIVEQRPDAQGFGTFLFNPRRHEPGAQTILGKSYADDGESQAQAVLDDLARHPATAKHVARKLAIAFVADDPPAALVERLEKRFRETDGDLGQVARALIDAPEAWDAPRAKMRSPQEFVFATARALGLPQRRSVLARGLASLGQPFWRPPSPKGYSLVGADWIAPDAQTTRLDLATEAAAASAPDFDPNDLAANILGDVLSDETRTAIKRAGSRDQALALLLMCPEMQRR